MSKPYDDKLKKCVYPADFGGEDEGFKATFADVKEF